MAKYSNTSPYFETSEIADYLDILNPRTLTAEDDDQSYTIERSTLAKRSSTLPFAVNTWLMYWPIKSKNWRCDD